MTEHETIDESPVGGSDPQAETPGPAEPGAEVPDSLVPGIPIPQPIEQSPQVITEGQEVAKADSTIITLTELTEGGIQAVNADVAEQESGSDGGAGTEE